MSKLIVSVLLIALALVGALWPGGVIFIGSRSVDISEAPGVLALILLSAILLSGLYLLLRVAKS